MIATPATDLEIEPGMALAWNLSITGAKAEETFVLTGAGPELLRGLLGATGMPARTATALHGAAIYGSAQVTLPALEIARPVVFWPKQEIAIDAFHHLIYAMATGMAYELIAGSATGRQAGDGA